MELTTHRVKGRTFTLAPLGDIQWSGTRGQTALDSLRRHIDHALQADAWFIGMGDYIDFMSPSNRQKVKASGIYETAADVMDDKAVELTMELYDAALKPTKGRWLGLLEGHHFTQLKTGDTSDMRLCQMLDAPFLGTSGVVRVEFDYHGRKMPCVVWAHHGTKGGGYLQGTALHELQQMAAQWEGVDVFVMGHVPKASVTPFNRVYPRWGSKGNELVHRTVYLVRTGGFSKSYVEGSMDGAVKRGNYAERKGYTPGYIGAPIIRMVADLRSHFESRLDIRVEV